jgi:hypothetical protein
MIEKRKNIFRVRGAYAIGFIISGGELIWVNKWFTRVTVEEEQVLVKYKLFDEWDGTFYWSNWEITWQFNKII